MTRASAPCAVAAAVLAAAAASAAPGYHTGPFVDATRIGELEPGVATHRDVQRLLGTPEGTGRARLPGAPGELELWYYDDFEYVEVRWTSERTRARVHRKQLIVLFRGNLLEGFQWWESRGRIARD